ncbi:hypothetical protein CXP34_06610 [Ralstonia mannitolilytica]|nr:hypothetical protein CXP34_06610 [Ralstonia mannitolilytica]
MRPRWRWQPRVRWPSCRRTGAAEPIRRSQAGITVAAPSHPLGSKPWVIRPADLDEHVQLVLTDRTTLTEGKTFGVFSPHRWRLADLGARHAFLRAGFGWGHMPVAMVQDDLDSGKLVPLQLEAFQPYTPPIAMFAVYRKDTPPGPAGRWFLKRLKAGRDNDQQ